MRLRLESALALLCLLPGLSGCVRRTHTVMKTQPPPQVLSSTLAQLVEATTHRYDSIQTLVATVYIVASTGGGQQGKVVTYTSFPGHILLRKPEDLRVLLLVPVAHVTALDMATDGKTFTLVIPSKNRAITGSNEVTTPSKNPLENLRPQVFTDSMLIRSAGPGEEVSMVSDSHVYQPDPSKKLLIDEPEYDLGIYRHGDTPGELKTLRVIHVGRATLLPFQQDIYDNTGRLVTVAKYEKYQMFGTTQFPSIITIQRPLDQLELKVTISKLTVNETLENDQFQVTIPPNAQVQHLP